jgi:hypothetical protein
LGLEAAQALWCAVTGSCELLLMVVGSSCLQHLCDPAGYYVMLQMSVRNCFIRGSVVRYVLVSMESVTKKLQF